jgi:uncharacterized coiled-coil DUF342 family protein
MRENEYHQDTMQRTLREHIDYLEQKIETLQKELARPDKSLSALNEIAIDIGIAERSLVHFRKAFELEQKLARAANKSN